MFIVYLASSNIFSNQFPANNFISSLPLSEKSRDLLSAKGINNFSDCPEQHLRNKVSPHSHMLRHLSKRKMQKAV